MADNKSIIPFIKSQIPKHISDSDSLFPSFVEAYYEWLNRPDNAQYTLYTLSTVTNIDKSIDKFTEEFFAEYLSNFPKDILTNKALTIKHISDLYKAKGTPAAYKLLFRILYNDKIDIIFPGEYVFKPSDNRWVQDFAFFVTVKSGDVFRFVGEEVVVRALNGDVTVFVERVKFIRDGFYQIFIDKNYIGTIEYGTDVVFDDVLCTIVPTTTKVKIKQAGSGFKLGDIFFIADGIGYGTTVKVNKLDSNGGIASVVFIEYGVGYTSNFDFNVSTQASTAIDTVIPGVNTTVNEYVKNIIDSGYLVKNDYVAAQYSDPTYAGSILSTFYAETANASDPNSAILSVEIGAVGKYLGYFNNNNSFPSDSIYLHDGEYYQSYSYVINSQVQFTEYKDILTKLIHPAGFALFGQYEIVNSFNIGANLQNLINAFKVAVQDEVVPMDSLAFSLLTNLSDSFTTSDISKRTVGKVLTDTQTISHSAPVFNVTKSLSDSVTVTDLIDYINTLSNLSDNASTIDLLAVSFIKSLADSTSAIDLAPLISTNKVLDDLSITSDDTSLYFTKALTDSITVTDLLDYIALDSIATDSATVSDVASRSFTKSLNDSVSQSETKSFDVSKVLDDVMDTLADEASIIFTKVLFDTVTVMDNGVTIIPVTPLNDSTSQTDVTMFEMSKDFTEALLVDDNYSYSINKILADTFGVSDASSLALTKTFTESLTTSDNNNINIGKSLSDSVLPSDDDILTFTKVLTDSSPADDTGFLWINPYVFEGDQYFAQDYITGITNFT